MDGTEYTLGGYRDTSAIAEPYYMDGSSDSLTLSGYLYGGDAQEIAGAAQGNVGGDDTLVVFQGAKQ